MEPMEPRDPWEGLERLRKRLLDLTLRNRLLNFRHTKRSSLRVVDELPDQLFRSLVDGQSLTFIPVPKPTNRELVEHYQQRGTTWVNQLPAAEDWAKHTGLRSELDLQVSGTQIGARHSDTKIQTLLYADDLEACLRNIARAARTAIEESGTNMLYLAIGFLEWKENDQARTTPIAPLILLPVIIERGPVERFTGTYAYKISFSGEEIATNLSLQEKLRQDFGLELPGLKEDELPEAYFRRVERELVGKPEWIVRRYVTLSLFHFGKLLMYLDLDPLAWPAQGILDHPIVGKYFGSASPGSESYGEDYRLDDQPELVARTPLVFDADSSQHSALIDAIQGKNLVIEGPPGTGKSQTITNLIAASLHQGKTVLFVSDKLAALEVVRRRLNEAGLGDFCLELHGHKTQKAALITEFSTRLRKRGSFPAPREIAQKLEILERQKAHLKQHSEVMAKEVGCCGKTVHEVLCAAARHRLDVGTYYAKLQGCGVGNPLQLGAAEIAAKEEMLDSYRAAHAEIHREYRVLSEHPWAGIHNDDLQPFSAGMVEQMARAWRDKVEGLRHELVELQAMVGARVYTSLQGIEQLGEVAPRIPGPVGDEWFHALPHLSDRINLERLTAHATQIARHQEVTRKLGSLFYDFRSVGTDDRSALCISLAHVSAYTDPEISVIELADQRALLIELARLVCDVTTLTVDLSRCLGVEIPVSIVGFELIQKVIGLCQQAPARQMHLRDRLFESEEVDDVLAKLIRQMESARKQSESLGNDYDLNSLPPSRVLRQAQKAMASGGIFRWFRRDWRSSNKLLGEISVAKPSGSPGTKADSLGKLAKYKATVEKVESDDDSRRVLQQLFRGTATQIDELVAVRKWYVTVNQELSQGLGVRTVSPRTLLELDKETIKAIAQLGQNPIANTLNQVASLIGRIGSAIPTIKHGRLDGPEGIINVTRGHIDELLRVVAACGIETNRTISEMGQIPELLEVEQEIRHGIVHDDTAKSILGSAFDGTLTNLEHIRNTLRLAEKLRDSGLPEEFKSFLFRQSNTRGYQRLVDLLSKIHCLSVDMAEKETTFGEFVQLDLLEWAGTVPANVEVDSLVARIDYALAHINTLAHWVTYIRTEGRLRTEGLGDFSRLVLVEGLPVEKVVSAYRCALFDGMAREILAQYPALRGLSGHAQNGTRDNFRRCDQDVILLQRQLIASKIDARMVPIGDDRGTAGSRTELRLLEHEANKQKRHIPIRQLMLRAGGALQALKPCFMMGPLSVAQYLQPGRVKFDLVVMDEASQIRPEDALGAIARGGQIVVVGDPRQLPPTRFFDRMFGDEEDGEDEEITVLEESESILDATLAAFSTPRRRLLWHYRSRHEKLISFSNHHFYSDNPMIVFPSPNPRDERFGVRLETIGNGTFKHHRNTEEALAVAKYVIRHMRNQRGESLGVVAMNNQQSELISETVEQLVKRDPQAQAYMESYTSHPEPFFVKNLENVQGDERDVVLVSATYGPAEPNGPVFQRFGPINAEMGWRRLNVLFTRAKNRIVVFSSMSSSDIRVGPDVSRGVRALRDYLAFAETGILEQARETGRPPGSDFEVSVADQLRHVGYQCEAQIGVAGFFIDLAVRHPDIPGKFLLGIECDGATYHSARSVRDRDRLRQAALESLGWNIHRIWSASWFSDPDSEIRRVVEKLEALRQNDISSRPAVTYGAISGRSEAVEDEESGGMPAETDRLEENDRGGSGAGFLTAEGARVMLVELRENQIRVEMPEGDPTEDFLRGEMIDALLAYRPTSKEEFAQKIPLRLRDRINIRQFARYREQVFSILVQIV